MAKWETKWGGEDSQDVGLEAATIQRKRNSSLVQSPCAENVTGLKPRTEATGVRRLNRGSFSQKIQVTSKETVAHSNAR